MKPDRRFMNLDKEFWANIRLISEMVGYTSRKSGQVRAPSLDSTRKAFVSRKLNYHHLQSDDGQLSDLGRLVVEYFEYRAKVLNDQVENRLMDVDQASALFEELKKQLNPALPTPMNKQRGEKKRPAYFTGIINMIIEAHSEGIRFERDPRQSTAILQYDRPLRTLARRVDGAFPSAINPIAVWEIKEYYYTTTFGSRVADAVYETLLDGMELEELREHGGIRVQHLLMVDSHYTWWKCGKSYLCKIIDMLHMGYVDQVLFGNEVVETLPVIVQEWVQSLSHPA